MVQLVEVPDEHYDEKQAGPEEDDAYYTDTDSSITDGGASDASDTSSLADLDSETLYDRIVALKDIIPPGRRAQITRSFNSTYGLVSSGLTLGGKTLWVLSTSALLLGVPYVLAWQEEQQVIEMEKEMQMQQNLNELITPGSKTSLGQPELPKR
ncbi:mitochondrial import receptor protein [Orbilia blumenaviensis]|uniref:Mitochondrial import receptor protein n=1 Tax=Orbilia blumenaviensis TaxID=1796055 RepID=A0AAV9UWP3_9PEZI